MERSWGGFRVGIRLGTGEEQISSAFVGGAPVHYTDPMGFRRFSCICRCVTYPGDSSTVVDSEQELEAANQSAADKKCRSLCRKKSKMSMLQWHPVSYDQEPGQPVLCPSGEVGRKKVSSVWFSTLGCVQ